jgi:hypothetical protein
MLTETSAFENENPPVIQGIFLFETEYVNFTSPNFKADGMIKHLVAFIFLISFSAGAQTSVYHPFPDSGAVWREAQDSYNSSFYSYNEQLFISGDTVIGPFTYHKIFVKGVSVSYLTFLCQWLSGTTYTSLVALIRQDIPNRKVYIYNNPDSLLYDFNLSVGDTLPRSYNHLDTSFSIVVTSIDSLFDGIDYRRRFYLSSGGWFPQDSISIIEGIGSTGGLFFQLEPPFEVTRIMHCFIQNDSIKYHDYCSIGCDLYIGITNITDKKNLPFLSPNPATNEIRIQNAEFRIENIEILDILGRTINSAFYILNSELKVDVTQLPPGMYFLKVQTEVGTKSVKFVKE